MVSWPFCTGVVHAETIWPKGLMEASPFSGSFVGNKRVFSDFETTTRHIILVRWWFDLTRSPVCDMHLPSIEYLLLHNPQLPAIPRTSNPVIDDWGDAQPALHSTFYGQDLGVIIV